VKIKSIVRTSDLRVGVDDASRDFLYIDSRKADKGLNREQSSYCYRSTFSWGSIKKKGVNKWRECAGQSAKEGWVPYLLLNLCCHPA